MDASEDSIVKDDSLIPEKLCYVILRKIKESLLQTIFLRITKSKENMTNKIIS